jgi:hypothetical protein
MKRFRYQASLTVAVFNVDTTGVSKSHSALPRLMENSVDFEEALAFSFFRCSTYAVKPELAAQLFERIERPRTAVAALGYARRTGLSVSEQVLLRFTRFGCQELNKIVSETLPNRIELLDHIETSRDLFRLALSPDSYLNEFMTDFLPKSRNLLRLSKLISGASFDVGNLVCHIERLLPVFDEIRSAKRLMAMLRLINQTIHTMSRKLPFSFLELINNKLQFLKGTDLAPVYLEVASILTRFFVVYKPDLLPIGELFDKSAPSFPLFIVSQAVAVTCYSVSSGRISKSFSQLFQTQVPSQKVKLLTALQTLVGSPGGFSIFEGSFNEFVKLFEENATQPLFDSLFCKLIAVIVGSADFFEIEGRFLEKVAPLMFQPPNSPQFGELSMAISVMSHVVQGPIPGYANFINSLINSQPVSPDAANFVREFVQRSLQGEADATRISGLAMQGIKAFQRLFSLAPTWANAQGLIEGLRVQGIEFDPALLLIAKLVLLPVPLLAILVLVQGCVRRCSQAELDACRRVFEAVHDSYPVEELVQGVQLVLKRCPSELLAFADSLQ